MNKTIVCGLMTEATLKTPKSVATSIKQSPTFSKNGHLEAVKKIKAEIPSP